MPDRENRTGFVGIVLSDRSVAQRVNALLSQYGRLIRARVGVPDEDSSAAVIGLIVEGDNDGLGQLTARLGSLPGVQVKSALVKKNPPQPNPTTNEGE